jgi:aryl-alcohol dehydrogenase-like predicted oxidoreductase
VFIEVLNDHRRDGTMRAFGASNWTLDRIRAANDYAAERGLEGFTAVSNQFSLARMEVPLWEGSVCSFDREWRDWFEREQIPLLAWSSQSRGFFVEDDEGFVPADWGDRHPGEVARHWGSYRNYARRDRTRRLGNERGVPPITIALAYVLNQPFPTFPIIGPRSISELNDSIAALRVDLDPAEVAWLTTGAGTPASGGAVSG